MHVLFFIFISHLFFAPIEKYEMVKINIDEIKTIGGHDEGVEHWDFSKGNKFFIHPKSSEISEIPNE